MNKLIIFISWILLVSCGQEKTTQKTENETTINAAINGTIQNEITYYKINGKSILLGKDIKLLDTSYKVIKDISYLNEQFVEVTEVSNNYHKQNPADDFCEEFKYVKIKTKDFEGIVDGRKVYEPIKHIQNKKIEIDNNNIEFIATRHFGIGVSDDDGLTGCSIFTPVLFSDKNANFEGFVRMIKNNFYDSEYPYFELKDDDGTNDQIEKIDKQDDNYLIKIKRTYQEGGARLLVQIRKDNNGNFVAEILEYERTEE